MSQPAATVSPEHPTVQRLVQRTEESSPLINTITAIAVSIITTILCYMTLPPQGATPIVAVVWILAYYFSFGSDCLDNTSQPPVPSARHIRRSSIPDCPSRRSYFPSPQKELPPEQRPGRSAPSDVSDGQFKAGSGQRTDDRPRSHHEIHAASIQHKRKLRQEERLAELDREKSRESPGFRRKLKDFKDRVMGSDSDSDSDGGKHVRAGSQRRTRASKQKGGEQFKAGSRRRTGT